MLALISTSGLLIPDYPKQIIREPLTLRTITHSDDTEISKPNASNTVLCLKKNSIMNAKAVAEATAPGTPWNTYQG